MVAGRVHLRLGQPRDAILGPCPSLLETSILPPPVAHLWYLPSIHPSTMVAEGPLPKLAGHHQPDGRSYMPAVVLCSRRQTRAHSLCTAP